VKARPSFRSSLAALIAVLTFGLGFEASAQSVTTTPVGAVTVTIAAGTGTVRSATVASFPLVNTAVTDGVASGVISSVSTNAITCSGAGWTTSGLAQASLPFLVKITSGTAAGRTFLVTANTADTLTVSTSDGASTTAIDLTQLGIVTGASGDKFQLENADTLLTIFGAGDVDGTNAPLGNSNPSLADMVQINTANSYQTYYYDPAQSAWINLVSEVPSNNLVIRPDTAVVYSRLKNTSFSITVTGSIPVTNRKAIIRSGQTTILSSYWPKDTTLADTGLHQLSGWVSSANPNTADIVQIRQGSSWQTYYHDGVNWINLVSEVPSNNLTVGVGSGLLIKKRALTAAPLILDQVVPYTL
jgi:uncharacterized protein (TIGR02597 family)